MCYPYNFFWQGNSEKNLVKNHKKKALKNQNFSIFINLKTIERIKRVFQKCINSKPSCQHWCGKVTHHFGKLMKTEYKKPKQPGQMFTSGCMACSILQFLVLSVNCQM